MNPRNRWLRFLWTKFVSVISWLKPLLMLAIIAYSAYDRDRFIVHNKCSVYLTVYCLGFNLLCFLVSILEKVWKILTINSILLSAGNYSYAVIFKWIVYKILKFRSTSHISYHSWNVHVVLRMYSLFPGNSPSNDG